MANKNKICEADVYLYPPTESNSPQMYEEDGNWAGVLKNPIAFNLDVSYAMPVFYLLA